MGQENEQARYEIKELLKQMTLKEKADLCSGKDFWSTQDIPRLGINSIMMADGPHGLRKHSGDLDAAGLNPSIPATCFPTAAASACSWDRALLQEIGEAIGEECQNEGVDVLLGPGANIKRSPLCGRNFEYFSEDPCLTGELVASLIHGIQSKNVGASLKHFAVNNQEKRRMTINALVDERALREIYLAGFERGVKKSQPWTIMTSYNMVNGTYASENKYLLKDILKDEWGFKGYIVTDWGACNDRVRGVFAGQDLEMPSSKGKNSEKIIRAVETGVLPMELLDETVERLLGVILKVNEKEIIAPKSKEEKDQILEQHHYLAEKAAIGSCVLLKNEDNILPLSIEKTIGVVGNLAEKPRYQGSGSSRVNAFRVDSPLEELRKIKEDILYEKGYGDDNERTSEELLKKACELAEKVDLVVAFVGLPDSYEAEAVDREHMRLPESHNQLIRRLAEKNKNIVVVLSNGSAVEIPWEGKVKGILDTFLGGQGIGGAVAKLLFGKENPSGKLAESFPMILEENSSYRYFPGNEKTVEYRESIFVGYRYYEAGGRPVRYPFGHGLSYTTFEYSGLRVSKTQLDETEDLEVYVTVKNTGTQAGAETVQLYVRDIESSVPKPIKELKDFEKVQLEPNELKTVRFVLDRRAFAYYDVEEKDWTVEVGQFEIILASSLTDIRCRTSIQIIMKENGLTEQRERNEGLNEYFNPEQASLSGAYVISEETFEKVLGRKLPDGMRRRGELVDLNTTLYDIKERTAGKIIYDLVFVSAKKSFKLQGEGNRDRELYGFVNDMPIRNLHVLNGKITNPNIPTAIVEAVNKNSVFAMLKLIKEFFR